MASEHAQPADGAPAPWPLPALGLLISSDAMLVRSFNRELRRCLDAALAFDVHATLEAALAAGGGPYRSVALDLNSALPPVDAVRRARNVWPGARVAVLSYWWSERDVDARALADLIIHKPLREAELHAFLRHPAGAPGTEPGEEPDPDIREAV